MKYKLLSKSYVAFLLILAVAGMGYILSSIRQPWYPEEAVKELVIRTEGLSGNMRNQEWWTGRSQLISPRVRYTDFGLGLIATSGMLGFLLHIGGVPLRDAHSPKNRVHFIVIYLSAIGIQCLTSPFYYGLRQHRFEYPPWADSMGIPISVEFTACIFIAILGSLLWWPFLAASRFPARLLVWPQKQQLFNVVISILLTACCIPPACLFPSYATSGNIGGVATTVVSLYLILSIRAGLVTRWAERKQTTGDSAVFSEREPNMFNKTKIFIILCILMGLCGCQTFDWTQFDIPNNRNEEVQEVFENIATQHALRDKKETSKVVGTIAYFGTGDLSFTEMGMRQYHDRVLIDVYFRAAGFGGKCYRHITKDLHTALSGLFDAGMITKRDRHNAIPFEFR